MINVIDLLLKNLYIKIPNEILTLAFKDEGLSLDSVIKEQVITDVVLLQSNLYSGRPKRITLLAEYAKDLTEPTRMAMIAGDYSVYQIPEEAREYRDINAVIDISYPVLMAFQGQYPYTQPSGNRSVMSSADDALTSLTRSPGTVTPQAVLMGNNIIKLMHPMAAHVDWSCLVWLALDENLTNVSPNMIKPLQQMTLYACQMVIHNKLAIRLNQGMLVGGQTLEAVKEIVDKYEDAEERFEEALMKMRGASVMQPNQLPHLLASIIGG